ncbi:MAG: hypothetical protein V5A30_06720 [Haloarculaceae archaeon]
MGDNKAGRESQADDADRRQRERDLATELERMDETEPPVEEASLEGVEAELETVSFPAPSSEVRAAAGDHTVESAEGTYTVGDLIPEAGVTFESPAAVRARVQRPTVAAAMKRVVEASAAVQGVSLGTSQREAYEKTFRSLAAIDADDDDEGIDAIADWIVGRIRDKGTLPGSRRVRKEAAKFCRSNGYEVRDDEWLGA